MLSGLLVHLLRFLFKDRCNDRGRTVTIIIDPWAIGVLVSFDFLPTEHLYMLWLADRDRKLILVHLDMFESFGLKNVGQDSVVKVIHNFLN